MFVHLPSLTLRVLKNLTCMIYPVAIVSPCPFLVGEFVCVSITHSDCSCCVITYILKKGGVFIINTALCKRSEYGIMLD